jgi:hypothetical protein
MRKILLFLWEIQKFNSYFTQIKFRSFLDSILLCEFQTLSYAQINFLLNVCRSHFFYPLNSRNILTKLLINYINKQFVLIKISQSG